MPNRILVVADKPDLELLITPRFRKRIRAEELSVQFAGNGEEARANIRTALNRRGGAFLTKPIDFQDLEITLDRAIAEAVERKQAAPDRDRLLSFGRDLELVRNIQSALVPHTFTQHERLSVYGAVIPAAQVRLI